MMIGHVGQGTAYMQTYSLYNAKTHLYNAKTHLSALVDRAAAGEAIVITKNGTPRAQLGPIPQLSERRVPAGAMRLTHIAHDLDTTDHDVERLFNGDADA
jgi:prevent-host-death family protein